MKLPKSLSAFFLKKNIKTLFLSTSIDILFFIALLLVYSFFFMRMLPSMTAVAEIASSDMGAAMESLSMQDPTAINELMPQLRSHYIFLITNLILMLLSCLMLFIITQCISWYKLNILFRKIKFKDYAKSFALASAVYFIISIISAPIVFNLLYLFSKVLGTPLRPVFASVMLVIFSVLSYFAVTSYSLIGEKDLFKKSFRKAFSKYALRFLASAFAIFIISVLLFKTANFITSPAIQFLIMLLVFPFITIAKLWLLE